MHGYVGLRLIPPLAGWSSAGPALGVLLATCALLLPLVDVNYLDRRASTILAGGSGE